MRQKQQKKLKIRGHRDKRKTRSGRCPRGREKEELQEEGRISATSAADTLMSPETCPLDLDT